MDKITKDVYVDLDEIDQNINQRGTNEVTDNARFYEVKFRNYKTALFVGLTNSTNRNHLGYFGSGMEMAILLYELEKKLPQKVIELKERIKAQHEHGSLEPTPEINSGSYN